MLVLIEMFGLKVKWFVYFYGVWYEMVIYDCLILLVGMRIEGFVILE